MMYRVEFELLPTPVQHAFRILVGILFRNTDYEGVQITITGLREEETTVTVDVQVDG